MSVGIKGLRPPVQGEIATITIGYLGWEERDECPKKIACVRQFFAEVAKDYSSRAHLNTYVGRIDLSQIHFEQQDFTRYLTPVQKGALRTCSYSAAKINGFIQQLHRRGGIAKIAADLAHYEEHPTLATLAYLLGGDVTVEQVTSVCLLYHGVQQFIKERYYVEIQHADPYYRCHFAPMPATDFLPPLRTYSVFENSELVRLFFSLNALQMSVLLDKLKSKPHSERYYHTIELPLGPILSPGHLLLIRIIDRFKPMAIGNDSFLTSLKRSIIVIPSFSMLQGAAEVLYGEDAMAYVPLIGECTESVIMHFKMQDKCVLQVGTKEAPLSPVADQHYCGVFSRILHDWYHGERGNWIGRFGRRAVRYLAGHVFGLESIGQTYAIVWALLDGELWRKTETFADIFTTSRIPWTDKHKCDVLRNMVLLHQFWKEEFGLGPDSLYPGEKGIYDAIASTITQEERQVAEAALFHYYKELPKKTSYEHFRLGFFYYSGYGTPISKANAIEHWELCGNEIALFNISTIYQEQLKDASSRKKTLDYRLQAAEAGHRQAQCDIGCWYYLGHALVSGVKRFDLALDFFKRAAAQEHPVALFNIGVMHRDAKGVTANLREALAYFRRAAALGQPDAQCEVGRWYREGAKDILPQDFDQARRHLKRSADQNYPKAFYLLGLMYENGEGSVQDLREAYALFNKAAELDDPDALNQLGYWSTQGRKGVVAIDLQRAAQYFAKADAYGSKSARKNLQFIELQLAKKQDL